MIEALDQHRALFAKLHLLQPQVERAAAMIADSLRNGGKLMLCGNGGSAADCQHIAAEFVGWFSGRNRPALSAIALTTDSSILTAVANDAEFESVFRRQVRALGRPGDVLLAISTSGRSQNVLMATLEASQMGIKTVGLVGCDGGTIGPRCDVAIVVPSDCTARIQEGHGFIGHTICAEVERLMVVV